jgi:adenosylcobinamide-GDP ribazoletransferase
MKALLSAIGFLTVLPVAKGAGIHFWAPVFFAPVGILIAGMSAAVGAAAGGVLPRGPVAVVQSAVWIVTTGALHLDGLVDVADALGSRDKEARLAVMKDSRVGTFGLVAGCLAIVARWQLLAVFSNPTQLLLAGALSRGAAGTLLGLFRPAVPGLAAAFGASAVRSLVAAAVTLAIGVTLGGLVGGILALVSGGLMVALLALQSRLFGGITGDCYGAAIELTELTLLFLGGLAWSIFLP